MKTHLSSRISAGSLALLAACAPATDEPSGPSPSVAVVGDTAFLELPMGRSADNGEISVTFDAVTEDSRCPSDVQCVWAGNGGVRLTLAGGEETDVVIVNSTVSPREISFRGYSIGYRELAPYPTSTERPDPAAYVVRIAVVDTR